MTAEGKTFSKIAAGVIGGALLLIFGTPLVANGVIAWDRWLARVLGN